MDKASVAVMRRTVTHGGIFYRSFVPSTHLFIGLGFWFGFDKAYFYYEWMETAKLTS